MFLTYERVRELCQKQGISLNDLENKLELGKNSLYGLKKSQPSSKLVTRIADYFNVSTDYLLGRTENPKIADDKERFYFEGKEVDVEELASTAMRFNGKPLTDKDKRAIQRIIEGFLLSQEE